MAVFCIKQPHFYKWLPTPFGSHLPKLEVAVSESASGRDLILDFVAAKAGPAAGRAGGRPPRSATTFYKVVVVLKKQPLSPHRRWLFIALRGHIVKVAADVIKQPLFPRQNVRKCGCPPHPEGIYAKRSPFY